MNTLVEVYRHTFPKRLRFDKASQVLYAQCYSLNKQYRNKKYIPKREIRDVLNSYTAMPGAPWLQLPIVRHVFLVRLVNGIRCATGRQSWLYNRNVESEHRKIAEWLDKATTTAVTRRGTLAGRAASSSRSGSAAAQAALEGMVERERFEAEVLRSFHVASMYHRLMRLGFVFVAALVVLLYASLHTDTFVYWYLRYWCGYSRSDVLAFFREITALHTVTEVPPAYANLLPPPCGRYTDTNGAAYYAVNMLELTLPQHRITIFAIPCPQAGEKSFYAQVGSVAEVCDGVLLEGVSFGMIDKLLPAFFFPLKDNTFAALGLHHRVLDILRNSAAEPPMLYPAGADIGLGPTLLQLIIPYELRCVYNPTKLSATKGEARVGWGYVRQTVDDIIAERTGGPAAAAAAEPRVLCLPWTVHQIVNLEASLVKYGFQVRNVYRVPWLREDHMGEHFCDYYKITE